MYISQEVNGNQDEKEPLVRFPSCTAMTLYYINVGEKSLRLT